MQEQYSAYVIKKLETYYHVGRQAERDKQSKHMNTGDIQYCTCNVSNRVLTVIVLEGWQLMVLIRKII